MANDRTRHAEGSQTITQHAGRVGKCTKLRVLEEVNRIVLQVLHYVCRKNSAVKGGMCQRKDMEKLAAQHFDKEKVII